MTDDPAGQRGGAVRPLAGRELEPLAALGVRARAVVEGTLAGLHRNPHRGSSVEFAEYKDYAPGDDIRHIDWRALGRVDRALVKQFEDETNLRAVLAVDTSGSMDFAFEDAPTKRVHAATLAASLAYLLLRQGDAPGLVTFGDRPGAWLPSSSRRQQLEDICAVLESAPARGPTSLERALAGFAERLRPRSLLVVVSDLLDLGDDLLRTARVLRRRGIEVVLFHVIDRAELTLPFEGLTLFEGLEGEGDLLVDPDDVRDRYVEAMREHIDRVVETCRRGDLEYHVALTDEPPETPLRAFLVSRQRGRR